MGLDNEESNIEVSVKQRAIRLAITTASILIIAAALVIVVSIFMKLGDKLNRIQPGSGVSEGNLISLSTTDGEMVGSVDRVSVLLSNRVFEDNTDIGSDELRTIDTYDGMVYMTYIGKDGDSAYEYIISHQPQEVGDMTDKILASYQDMFYSYKSLSGDRGEVVKGLSMQGFMYLSEFGYGDDESNVTYDPSDDIVGHITNSIFDKGNTDVKTTLNLDGLGALDLNSLSFIKGKAEFSFSNINHIAKVYNGETDEAMLFISNINNQNLTNDSRKLVQVPGWNNVYLDLGWHHATDFGFGGFGIQGSSGFYYFKLGETIEDKESAMYEILNAFGISDKDDKIESIVTPIFEIDDLFPKLTLEEAKRALENEEELEEPIITDDGKIVKAEKPEL